MGSGFESQGAHFKKIPLILRNWRDFCVPRILWFFWLEVHIILFAPAGDPSSQSSDTLMSLRAIPSFLAWLPSAAMGNIYTSVHLWFRGSWNPAGSLGCAVVPCVRPVPSELVRGRAAAV